MDFFKKNKPYFNDIYDSFLSKFNIKVNNDESLNNIYIIITNHNFTGFKKFKEVCENAELKKYRFRKKN